MMNKSILTYFLFSLFFSPQAHASKQCHNEAKRFFLKKLKTDLAKNPEQFFSRTHEFFNLNKYTQSKSTYTYRAELSGRDGLTMTDSTYVVGVQYLGVFNTKCENLFSEEISTDWLNK